MKSNKQKLSKLFFIVILSYAVFNPLKTMAAPGQIIMGDGSGGGGGGAGSWKTAGSGGTGGGGDDTIVATTEDDVIFGDGSGGGGGLQFAEASIAGGIGGGGSDFIQGNEGNDIIFGDGFGGRNATYVWTTQYEITPGHGGLGGGGGGGGSAGANAGAIDKIGQNGGDGGICAGGGGGGGAYWTSYEAGAGGSGGIHGNPGETLVLGDMNGGDGGSGADTALAGYKGGLPSSGGSGGGGGAGFGISGDGGNGGVGNSTDATPGSTGDTAVYTYPDASSAIIFLKTTIGLANILNDYAGPNWASYGTGNDTIDGGGGSDDLFGLGGNDIFLFELTHAGATDEDVIWDFNVSGSDTLSLKNGGQYIDNATKEGIIAGQIINGNDRSLVFSGSGHQITITIKNIGRNISEGDFIDYVGVTTTSITSITSFSASSGGTITLGEDAAPITARGVCWNTVGNPTTGDNTTSDGSGTGAFISNLTGLTSGTTYYVRAYAINGSGTVYGTQNQFTTQVPTNNALTFDGTDDNVTIPDSSNLDITTNITIEAWVYINTLNQHAFFIDKCFSEMTGGFAISYETNDNLWLYLKEANDVVVNGDHYQAAYVPKEKMLGAWHHVAATYDGISSKLFLDGVLVSEKAASGGGLSTNDNPLIIGSVRTNGYYVDGSVDEVRIWNVAKTADEIGQNMYRELEGNEAGLVAYYNFNESGGTTLYDRTTKSNNGTFNGAGTAWVESQAMKPVNITISDVTTTGLTASWTEGGATDTFNLQIADNAAFTNPINITANLDSNGDSTIYSYNITGQNFIESTPYYYRMAVRNESGTSSYSETKEFMVAPGNALDFDGTDDYVEVANNASLDISVTNQLTIEAWVKIDNLDAHRFIISKDWGTSYALSYEQDQRFWFYLLESGDDVAAGDARVITEPISDILGEWHHIAGTYEGTSQNIYLDGELVATGVGRNTGLTASSGNLFLGYSGSSGAPHPFDGSMDEVKIWNTARSADQIRQSMYRELEGNEAGLVAYYNFNSSSGTALEDKSSNSNEGILTNMDPSANWVASDCFNKAPTEIQLSSQSLAENLASGTEVAVITATNEESGDTLTYSLTAGTGDTDNASFTISGDKLNSAEEFNYEIKNQYNIRIRVEDGTGHFYEDTFIIDITDIAGEMEVLHLNSGHWNTMLSYDTGVNYAWGSNADGMFGYLPDAALSQTPLTIPNHNGFTQLSSYFGYCTLATQNDGTAWSWGQNYHGRLGSGSTNKYLDNPLPVQITSLLNIKETAASSETAYALTNDGDVYSWGYEHRGALGNGISGTHPNVVYTPTKISGDLDTLNITSIEAGYLQGFALTDTGDVYSWGGQYYGVLGTGVAEGSAIATPAKIASLSNITKMDVYYIDGVALDTTGDVFAWGNQFGQGLPQEIAFFEDITVVDVAVGQGYILALDDTGNAYSVGSGSYGALGLGDTGSRTIPEQITALAGKTITSIHTDSQHSFAITQAGEVYGWGRNDKGQLGDGTFTDQLSPILISSINAANVADIVTSGSNTFIINNDTTIDVIGSNCAGMFADGLQPYNRVPGNAANIPEFDKISLAREHGVGLKSDGTVWTWGVNSGGQLGDGTYINKYIPVQVVGAISHTHQAKVFKALSDGFF
ncbi:exported hypothetical protein [Desulfamplus magnetovallimortis]|uniref:Uncharacterized protein n=1 Tax=Desulfamplus magnetovallimortis TaxID=1246637 RepID=A0A1W1H672_9BACT|nr:LamG-like jellyroll fold domain-containing protein [Desulfamplus magnetovallimortis]SLM27868.1 exported hypothetical protein [Desulfamplus magnetovallimortis]